MHCLNLLCLFFLRNISFFKKQLIFKTYCQLIGRSQIVFLHTGYCQTLGLVLRLRVDFVLPLSQEQQQEEQQQDPNQNLSEGGVLEG